ncbi:MAG: FtsQ-type POTRA domain-containing protein [Proteobacteria bacterium]|nr:FtsQ-type POTRA domain-containing protein [Pseudomonadota bacterium]
MPTVKTYRNIPSKRQKAQRAPHQTFGVRRLSSVIIIFSFCGLFSWSYFYAPTLMSLVMESIETSLAQVGFKLEDVVVEGRIRTDKDQILKMAGLERGKPLFSIRLSETKNRLEEISWINAVRVERRFPDTLFIRISEKEPVAIWLNQAKTYLVDRDGELMETDQGHQYKELLLITGDEAPHHVGQLVTLLEKFPELKYRVTGATHLRSTRWDIRLDGKVDVKLPEKEADKALAYLMDLEKQHRLTNRDIVTIDMRLPNQLILRLTPEAAKKKHDSGKDA